jgi:hypothetical protein
LPSATGGDSFSCLAAAWPNLPEHIARAILTLTGGDPFAAWPALPDNVRRAILALVEGCTCRPPWPERSSG